MNENSLEYKVLDEAGYHRFNRNVGVGLSIASYALSACVAAAVGAATYFNVDSLGSVYLMGFVTIPTFFVVGRLSYALSKEHAEKASELEGELRGHKKPATAKHTTKARPQKA
jgi:hypothetical protein